MNFNETTDLAPASTEETNVPQVGTTPSGAEEFGEPGLVDPLAGATDGRRLNGSVILIFAVVLSALAGLFSMRKIAEVTAAPGINSEIEATIVKFLDKVSQPSANAGGTQGPSIVDYQTLLAVITETYSERQVPLRDVQRDPFVIETQVVEVVEPVEVVDPDALGKREREEYQRRRLERQTELESLAQGFRLKSIMGGSAPMAIIDDQIVHVGDYIMARKDDVEFRVTRIAKSSVDLVTVAPEFELSVTVTLFLQR